MAVARGKISRRTLIKGGLAVGAGLVVGFEIPPGGRRAVAQQAPGLFTPNQWITIDRDGLVTIINSVVEMGQGSLTTMPMIVADELDADLGRIKVQQAPANPALYANPVTKTQSYGGSRGVRDHMQMLRKAGAAARQMLMQAAANEWGAPLGEVTTDPGVVIHKPTGRRLPYGALVDKAAQLPVPQDPKLKTPDQFRYIGKIVRRRDTPVKVNGTAIFGMDVQVPGMLIASIERCPVFGGEVKSFDATAARRVKGVSHVVKVTNGVAVVADSFWAALQGRKALKVTWDEGALATLTSAQISSGYAEAAKQKGREARKDGDVEKALAAGGKVVEAIYEDGVIKPLVPLNLPTGTPITLQIATRVTATVVPPEDSLAATRDHPAGRALPVARSFTGPAQPRTLSKPPHMIHSRSDFDGVDRATFEMYILYRSGHSA